MSQVNNFQEFNLQSSLNDFQKISLDELDSVKLLDRHDTKFVFNESQLSRVLGQLKSFYNILEIKNCSLFKYSNTYFDTNNFLFFRQHHNENRNRYKVRLRKYSSSPTPFFEIKIKNNKNRTIKKRLLIDKLDKSIDRQKEELTSNIIGLSFNQLSPVIDIQFSRITLADKNFKERITLDTNISTLNGTTNKIFDKLVVAEIKQEKYNCKSDFIKILRNFKIPDMRFSKYCMGMVSINTEIKHNRFKPKLLQINKILAEA